MRDQNRSLATSTQLPELGHVFDQYKASDMQNQLFNQEKNTPNYRSLQFQQNEQPTPVIPPLGQEEYSNNILNIGFIAQDSKFALSDSLSYKSDNFSISGISVVRASPKESPHIINEGFDEDLSQMDEWSQNSQVSLTNRNFKRNKPETVEDEEQLQNHLTKKKRNEKNRVITINQPSKGTSKSRYMLRSKTKIAVDEDSSSNEDIRQLLVFMQKPQKGGKLSKHKTNTK